MYSIYIAHVANVRRGVKDLTSLGQVLYILLLLVKRSIRVLINMLPGLSEDIFISIYISGGRKQLNTLHKYKAPLLCSEYLAARESELHDTLLPAPDCLIILQNCMNTARIFYAKQRWI